MLVVHVKYEGINFTHPDIGRVLCSTTYPTFNLRNIMEMRGPGLHHRFLDMWNSEKDMRFSRKELFIVQKEIIDSMTTTSSKAIVKCSFTSAKNNSISIRTLQLRIKRQLIQGHSTFKNLEEIKEILDYKRYMIKNSHIYGDYNENKIQNT